MSDALNLQQVESFPPSARLYTAADPALNDGKCEVIFIENNVAEWETLIPRVKPGVEVVILDSRNDGLSQMVEWVKGRPAYDAVHVISHGSEGHVDLGALTLDSAAVEKRSADLANLGSALTADGDLLLYGCGIGGGTGTAFLSLLANATGADVSASTDITGAAIRDGNWTLEAVSGPIEAQSLEFSAYDGILSTTLSAGDLAVVNFNASTDTFKVVALADISTGTTINFTDRGWSNSYGTFTSNVDREGTLSWTTSSDIAAGSVLSFSVTTNSHQYLNLTTGGNLSGTFLVADWGNPTADALSNQDQVIIYQGSDLSPTFIFGYNNNAASTTSWWNFPVSSSSYTQSNIPGEGTGGALNLGTSAIGTPNGSRPYAGYTGDMSAATRDVWLSRLANPGNWTLAGSTESPVVDTIGNRITVMAPPKVSTVTAANVMQSDRGSSSYSFSIRYSDSDNGIAAASIGTSDVSVKRAGGNALTVTNASWDAATNTATYTVAAPGGTWDDSDNGTYTIAIGSNEIADDSDLTMAANASAGSFTVSMDTTAPDAPLITGIADDTGSSATDCITSDQTLIITGSAEANATITVYKGSTSLGTTIANGSGTWSYDYTGSTLAEGSHTFKATATDAPNNQSAESSPLTLTIDTSAPAGTSLSAASFLTTNAAGAATLAALSSSDSLAVTYALAVGNGANDVDNGRFTISGSSLNVGGSSLTAGTYHVYVSATDAAGNVAYQPFTLTVIDPPSVSSIIRAGGASSIVASSASSANYTVTFSQAVTGVDASDFALTGTGTASGAIAGISGSGTTYTVTIGSLSGDGTLRLDLNSSGTGIQSASDVAISGGYTSGATYTLDHTEPAAPSVPDMASGSDTGSSSTDNLTSNTTPIFTGTAESGSTVTLYDTDGTTVLGTGTATGGNWSITTSALAAGSHTIKAKATDAAGNTSAVSADQSVTIDTTGPAVASVLAPADGSYHAGQALTLTVNTNEAVVVDTQGGVPHVALTVGGTVRNAIYVSGSGTNALQFSYTIQPGDSDADGIAVGALSSNGGTFKDAAGNNMTLTLNNVGLTGSVLVDTTAPVIDSVNVPANGTYYRGQTLDFTVNFSEAVSVDTSGDGTPRIAITLDTGGTVYADYLSGSGTQALVFRHVVADGELDANGITVESLDANGGTLRDMAGNDASLTLNSIGSTAQVNVDGTQPLVSGVTSSTSNGDYRAGATISISVDFTKAVTVDTTHGIPTLALASGGTATYASGSGTSTLVFNYIVGDGENAADLDYSSTGALSLNGAAIKDIGGLHLDAQLTLAAPGAGGSLGNGKDIVIDTTVPAISIASVAFSNDTGTLSTDFITRTASQTISGTLSANLAAGESVYVSLDDGTTWSVATATVGQNTWALAGQTLTGSSTLKVRITDAAGNSGAIASQAYTLDTSAPTINASGSTPADNASGDPIGSDIVIKFAEALQGNSDTSKVYLKDVATGSTIAATITINGNGKLVIHPGHNLSYSTAYYVNWDSDALLDAAGNAASALTDKTTYNFTTEGEPPAPPPLPKDDGDNIPATTEQQVPSLPLIAGGTTVAGDGNGDGKVDSEQANVTSVPFLKTDTAQSNPGNAPPVFVTLVADAVEGKTDATKADAAVLKEVKQLDAPADLPSDMQLPIGQISFKADVKTAGTAESFSLYVDGSVAINGYWKQNKAGTWVNLASDEYGGKVVTEGGKTRLDFKIVDGGEFDDDGKADGVITDPGGPGYRVMAGTTITDADKDQFPDNLEAANGLTVGTKDNDVFGSSKLFVMELYRDLLFREAELDGLAHWLARIDGGVQNRAQVASAFLDSPEFQGGAGGIARLYLGALDRLPDDTGMDTWMGKHLAGTSLAAIADSFAASTEFQVKYGAVDNAGFVQQLYQNVLHRGAEQAGLDFWTGQLASGAGRGQVLLGFTESAEYKAASDTEVTVALNYVGLLGRTPEQAGYDHWIGLAGQGMTEVEIIGSFMAAPEYHDRFLP